MSAEWNELAKRLDKISKNYLIPDPRYSWLPSESVPQLAAYTNEQTELAKLLSEFCRAMASKA